jgi:N utilization substance protein A
MESKNLIDTFADFARSRNIDRTTVIRILEEVFRAMIVRKFNTDSNFDVIINLDQGDLQIWRFREIVDDNSEHIEDYDKISLSEAKSIESDFKVGEEVSEEISIDSFGRRAITVAKNTLIEQVKDLASNTLHAKYKALIGEMITSKVSQVLHQELILLDDENNELFLPKSQQIAKDNFKKGDYVHAIISRIELQKKTPKIILSRTSPALLEKLLESEIPEISEGLITIKKVVREPGERAKVAVEACDDRIDPIGACVGMKGSRIHGIVRELRNENIDIINYTPNLELYISRALSPAKISTIQQKGERIVVYLKPDQVALAIGKNGYNIKLASALVNKEIDVYREIDNIVEDVRLEEFQDEIDPSLIEELKHIGLDSAKKVLAIPKEELKQKIDFAHDKIAQLYDVLSKEFEE